MSAFDIVKEVVGGLNPYAKGARKRAIRELAARGIKEDGQLADLQIRHEEGGCAFWRFCAEDADGDLCHGEVCCG